MVDNRGMPQVENAFAGIVVTAQTFNPSIFSETWLTQNGIIPADAFVGLKLVSSEVAQFQTLSVQVLVIPPKMQITFAIHEDAADTMFPRKVATQTVELLPHTPYQSLGLNFDFFVSQPASEEFGPYNRALLGSGSPVMICGG